MSWDPSRSDDVLQPAFYVLEDERARATRCTIERLDASSVISVYDCPPPRVEVDVSYDLQG